MLIGGVPSTDRGAQADRSRTSTIHGRMSARGADFRPVQYREIRINAAIVR